MPVLKQFTKDPNADKDYIVDWTRWLQSGEVIVNAAWTLSPSTGTLPLAKHDEALIGGKKASVFLKDGDVGAIYTAAVKITTSNTPPRVDERSIGLLIAQQ